MGRRKGSEGFTEKVGGDGWTTLEKEKRKRLIWHVKSTYEVNQMIGLYENMLDGIELRNSSTTYIHIPMRLKSRNY